MQSTEHSNNMRPLTMSDVEVGREFTIGQLTTVTNHNGRNNLDLKVGDVVKVEGADPSGISISVNGHHTERTDQAFVPLAEFGDIVIADVDSTA